MRTGILRVGVNFINNSILRGTTSQQFNTPTYASLFYSSPPITRYDSEGAPGSEKNYVTVYGVNVYVTVGLGLGVGAGCDLEIHDVDRDISFSDPGVSSSIAYPKCDNLTLLMGFII